MLDAMEEFNARPLIQAKKNPGQLMDARDLKMHKPWW